MEKFTVDLDKVLDEFEFNEERAFHQENFKNEDLPAKKYQKPHFQPINMADADFGPSIVTTMSFHSRKESQDSTNSSTASENVSFNCRFSDVTVNQTVISDLIKAPVVNNFQVKEDLNQVNNEFGSSNCLSSNADAVVEEPKMDKAVQEVEDVEGELNSINVDVIPEENRENSINKIIESQTKPDLIGSECDTDEKDKILKLPDLTDVKKENCPENESDKIENLDLISNEKDMVEHTQKEVNDNEEEEIEEVGEVKEEKMTDNNSDNKSKSPSPVMDGESETDTYEIQPIQFQSDNDITDEDLHRYLEELEEEEERNTAQAEVKPVRPDFLNLNDRNKPERSGSPVQTPLPGDVVEHSSPTKENEINEVMEAPMEDVVPQAVFSGNVSEAEESGAAAAASRSSVEPLTIDERRLGKVSPYWMPDHFASNCMDCDCKFTVIKRRHHCRACGRILCSKCCGMRASLEYLQNQEQRVCNSCFQTLAKVMMHELQSEGEGEASPTRRPNPNNPMEYCSTVPPPLQVSSASSLSPPSVLVPVGVLKREGTAKVKENTKQVMFSDGIRPGGDLTDLDGSVDQRRAFRRAGRTNKRVGTPPGTALLSPVRMLPPIDPVNQSFIPENGLPPVCVVNKGETTYQENWSHDKLIERLSDQSQPSVTFAVNRHLIISLKIVKLDCCMNKTCWVFSTKGMEYVGQDEILILLTLKDENDDVIPRDIFLQLHYIYQEAAKGNTIMELGCWCVESNFLDSQQHGGFLFVRPTFQCLNHIETPTPPFLVAVLIHRSEVPWARVFPIRLMLGLGAEFRYYPCPLVSVRFREPIYYEIGHTIIKILADFRNLSYTLPNVRGLRIHLQPKQATILIPRNRYDQVIRALNNSHDPVLALAGNFSEEADAHLVCTQSKGDEATYKTQTINISDKPRKLTGASFVVFNGALKSTIGLAAKKSLVEDGLLVQVPNDTMTELRDKLRSMEDWSVKYRPEEGDGSEEVVEIIWCEDDKNFNIGVKSMIDNMALDGILSIRTHNFADCMGSTKFIRWTQVFILKCEDGATSAKIDEPPEVNKLSENIARATCIALKKLLDLLAASGLTALAVRATIDQDNVGYEAGSNREKLPPIYMNSLDNELIPVLHKAASVNDSVTVLELIFHIMDI